MVSYQKDLIDCHWAWKLKHTRDSHMNIMTKIVMSLIRMDYVSDGA